MLIESIINLLVGLSIFIVGMNMMSAGLKKVSGPGVRSLFQKIQNNKFLGILIGVLITAIIQSSSATSIMVIGFLNAGIMSITQGISIMFGAFIGTSMTGLIVSLSSFSISIYLTLFAFIGLVLTFLKNEKVKHIGEIFTGFGILFFALSLVSKTFTSNAELKDVMNQAFTSFSFPLLLFLIGLLFTAILQSSSATISIFIVMVGNEVLSFESAMYLSIGATVGALVPIILSTIGGSIESKKAVYVSVICRFVSALLAVLLIWPFEKEIAKVFEVLPTSELQVAIFTIVYNIISILISSPFVSPLIKLFDKVVKDKNKEDIKNAIKFIDDRFISTPEIAISQVKKEIENMAHLAYQNFILGYEMIMSSNVSKKKELDDREEEIDYINNVITEYLIKLSPRLSENNENVVGSFFHVVNDIERIGDHASNFLDTTIYMNEKGVSLKNENSKELQEMYDVIIKMFDMAIKVFDQNEVVSLKELHALEEKTDDLKTILNSNHYDRIVKNECAKELSPFYTTFISELERIADHLTNVGYSVVNPTGDEVEIKE